MSSKILIFWTQQLCIVSVAPYLKACRHRFYRLRLYVSSPTSVLYVGSANFQALFLSLCWKCLQGTLCFFLWSPTPLTKSGPSLYVGLVFYQFWILGQLGKVNFWSLHGKPLHPLSGIHSVFDTNLITPLIWSWWSVPLSQLLPAYFIVFPFGEIKTFLRSFSTQNVANLEIITMK